MKRRDFLRHSAVQGAVLFAALNQGDEIKAQKPVQTKLKIHKIEELTASQINALDREKTVFLLAVGTLEQHGSHLPIGTDTFHANFYVDRVSENLSKLFPDRTIVLMPTINYGNGGANEIGDRLTHPGTYGIRQTTLRSIVADVGGQLAQNGFKWIFVIHSHGAPNHNTAISDACDFVSETFKATMLNLDSIASEDAGANAKMRKVTEKFFSQKQRDALGIDIHAGTKETSRMLAIRPELVNKIYKTLPDQRANSEEDFLKIAKSPDWNGYFSSPSNAGAAYGKELLAVNVETYTNLIVRAMRGENLFDLPRFPTEEKEFGKTEADWNAHEREFEKKLNDWLKQKRT